MRRLKHDPELVAWGEAYRNLNNENVWVTESIYPLLYPTSNVNLLDTCELPQGQYLLKTYYAAEQDSVYIGSREFKVENFLEATNGGYYDCDGFYEPYNGEMVISSISLFIDSETNKESVAIFIDVQAPSQEEGSFTYKLWRIA